MDTECVYCLEPERYNLLPDKLHTFVDVNRSTVTKLMHLEIKGVSTSAGLECKKNLTDSTPL